MNSLLSGICSVKGIILEHLEEDDCGRETADALFPAAACLALFSSFSNTRLIPPSWKYSWQTLQQERFNSYKYQISYSASNTNHEHSYLRHHSMRPSPSHLFAQWLSAKFFMAMAYSLRVCSSSQCSRHIFSKSPTAAEKTKQRSVQS